jgi:ABC-type transport system substrate-binding protein
LPPGIFGHLPDEKGYNPIVYEVKNHKVKRKSINQAKELLTQAGFKGGINPKTNQPLTLYLDATMSSGPDSQAMYAWVRKQFKKIGLELVVRATQYNRFQEKMRTGNAQIFSWGWNADYPDPENFLFLLYGPNGKTKFGGENAVNYANVKYDELFDKMKGMPNGQERQAVIDEMLEIVRDDSPWVWGFHPKMYALSHSWMTPQKPNAMSRNTLKYVNLDPVMRADKRSGWNRPIFWPIILLIVVFILLCIPAWLKYRHKILTPTPLQQRED